MTNTNSDNPPKLKTYTYVENSTRTLITLYLYWIFIFFNAVSAAMTVYALIKNNNLISEQSDEAKNTLSQIAHNYDTAWAWTSLVFIFCAIAFLFWLYRASSNTHAFNPQTKMGFYPGLCVGCYFIPIFNLYWPYTSMKELWVLNVKKNTGILLIWWITFLIFNFAPNQISTLLANHSIDLRAYILLKAASNIFGIVSAIIAIKIITNINKAQIKNVIPIENDKK